MKNESGYTFLSLMVELTLIGIIALSCLALLRISTKETMEAMTYQELENEISKSIALLYAATKRTPLIFGIPFHSWRKSEDKHPGYINSALEKLSNQNKIKYNTIFLESLDYPSVFLSRHVSNDEVLVFSGYVPAKHISTLSQNRWIGIHSRGIFKVTEKPFFRRHINDDTWEIHFNHVDSDTHILHESTSKFSAYTNTYILSPIYDHFLLYINNRNELRRYSLITFDNQPVSNHIESMRDDELSCKIRGSKKGLELAHTFPCTTTYFEPFMALDFLDF
jgi:hypothetical protein